MGATADANPIGYAFYLSSSPHTLNRIGARLLARVADRTSFRSDGASRPVPITFIPCPQAQIGQKADGGPRSYLIGIVRTVVPARRFDMCAGGSDDAELVVALPELAGAADEVARALSS
jgi:hypothetical protein